MNWMKRWGLCVAIGDWPLVNNKSQSSTVFTMIISLVAVIAIALVLVVGIALYGHRLHRQRQAEWERGYAEAHQIYKRYLEQQREIHLREAQHVLPPRISLSVRIDADGTVNEIADEQSESVPRSSRTLM